LAIRGGQVKSVKALRNSMKKGGSDSRLKRIPGDEPMVVRFLQEPDEWFEFFEHWDDSTGRPAICTDDCDYCADDVRVSKRALASVVVISEGKVEPLVLPSTLVNRLLTRYDKYHTMIDRNYELIRTGKGLDTEYDVEAEPPTKMRLSRYETLDAAELLESMAPGADDDDEDDEPPARSAASKSKRRVVEDDEDDDEDETPPPRTRRGVKPGVRKPVPVDDADEEDEEDEKFLRPPRRPAVKPKSSPRTSGARAPLKKTAAKALRARRPE
jgi:hypothetical protein